MGIEKTPEKTPIVRLSASIGTQIVPPRVLLAAKDGGMRRLLATPLAADGYEIVEAEDESELLGALALSMLEGRLSEPVHAIVVDAREDADILEALVKLRKADYATPVVVILAAGDRESAKLARELAASAIFTMPFHAVDLRSALHRALDEAPTAKMQLPPRKK